MTCVAARQDFWPFPPPRGHRGAGCARLPVEGTLVSAWPRATVRTANHVLGHMDAATFNASLEQRNCLVEHV